MKESRIYITAFIISFIVGFIVSGLLMSKCSKPQDIIKTDTITITDTMWKDTTIIEKEFIPKEVIKRKVDTLYLENGDTMTLTTEQKKYEKSIVSDKDTADVEIYVTGINTALDSLKMRLKTHTITNTVEITKIVKEKKRFYIAPSVGVGYGFINKKPDVFIGVSFGVNL